MFTVTPSYFVNRVMRYRSLITGSESAALLHNDLPEPALRVARGLALTAGV